MDNREQYDKNGHEIEYVISARGLKILIWTIVFCLFLVVGGFLFGGYKFLEYSKEAPPLDEDKLEVSVPSKVLDVEGNVLTKIGIEDRTPLVSEDVPQLFNDALISTEDRRYYEHNGFDLIRIGKSTILTITSKLGLGGSRQGGSTLTQQLVKLSFLDQTDISLKRKAQEAYLSWKLERQYTKDELLLMYENKVYMGDGVYGIGTASKYFYGKPLAELTVPQLAFLAGKPNDPNELNPYTNPEYSTERRNIVLESMYANNKITEKEYKEYIAVPITDGLKPQDQLKNDFTADNAYTQYLTNVVAEAKKLLGEEKLYNDGLTINTSLDIGKQNYANKVVQTNDIIAHPNENIIYSFAVLDTHTGRILTEASGNTGELNNYTVGGYNYTTDIRVQAGSTMKPILAYAPAIEYLGYNTGTIINDAPYTFADGNVLNNYDFAYQGNISMRKALAGSRNTTAVRTLDAVGLDTAYTFANKLGFNYKPEEYLQSGVIGGVSNASPLILAQAFATFGNNGVYNEGHYITSIVDKDGTNIYLEKDGESVMGSSTAYMTTDMLRSAVIAPYGVSNKIKVDGLDIAGKTGTTNYSDDEYSQYGFTNGEVPDTWAIGYNNNYTIACWVGYKDRSQGVTDAQRDIVQYIVANLFSTYSNGDAGTMNQPDTVTKRNGELYKNE